MHLGSICLFVLYIHEVSRHYVSLYFYLLNPNVTARCLYIYTNSYSYDTAQVDSRIIIDTYAWNRFNPNRQVSLATLAKPRKRAPRSVDSDPDCDSDSDSDSDSDFDNDEDAYDDYNDDEDYASDVKCGEGSKPTLATLTKCHLLLCGASLKGYSLRNKKWLTFSIGSVKDIRYNEGAFDSLVLPDDHKELILALTESQVAHKETFDDVIQGKGKGMIMLLSGPPGVGKTLTAESGESSSSLFPMPHSEATNFQSPKACARPSI